MTNTYCVYTVSRYSWWCTVDMSETCRELYQINLGNSAFRWLSLSEYNYDCIWNMLILCNGLSPCFQSSAIGLREYTTAETLDLRVYDVCDRIPNKNVGHVTRLFKDRTGIWLGYESSPGMTTGIVTTRWPFLSCHTHPVPWYSYIIPSANVPVDCTLCRNSYRNVCVCG